MAVEVPAGGGVPKTTTTSTPVTTTTGGSTNDPNGVAAGTAAINAALQPTLAASEASINQQAQDLNLQEGVSEDQFQSEEANLNTNYGFQQQQNQLTSSGLALSGTELAQQQTQQNAAQQFEETGFGQTMQGLQAQLQQLGVSYGQQQTATQEGGAASGTLDTKGYSDTVAANAENYQYNQGQQQLGIQEAGTSQNAEQSSYAYSQTQDVDAQQQLQQQYSQLGLTQNEQAAALSQAQTSLGLQNFMTQDEFSQQLANLYAGYPSTLEGLETQLISAAPDLGGVLASNA